MQNLTGLFDPGFTHQCVVSILQWDSDQSIRYNFTRVPNHISIANSNRSASIKFSCIKNNGRFITISYYDIIISIISCISCLLKYWPRLKLKVRGPGSRTLNWNSVGQSVACTRSDLPCRTQLHCGPQSPLRQQGSAHAAHPMVRTHELISLTRHDRPAPAYACHDCSTWLSSQTHGLIALAQLTLRAPVRIHTPRLLRSDLRFLPLVHRSQICPWPDRACRLAARWLNQVLAAAAGIPDRGWRQGQQARSPIHH